MAWAEEVSPQGLNLTITSHVEFDRDTVRALLEKFGLREHRIEFIDALLSLRSSASEEMIIADQGAQYALKLDGEDILTCAGEVGEEGLLIASSLFPNYP